MFFNFVFNIASSTLKAYWFIFYSLLVSLVIFISFYIFYLPVAEHTLEVYFKYQTDCGENEGTLCSFPSAEVLLYDSPKASKEGFRVLARGQGYAIILELEMPLSEENRKLGMFLVEMYFMTKNRKVTRTESRSALLSFESSLLTTLKTLFYALPLVTGMKKEKEILVIPLVEQYVDDSYEPVTSVIISLHSKRIQFYSAKLRFRAEFTGLRYYMQHWPLTFSFIGFLCVLIVVALFCLYRVIKHIASSETIYTDYGDLSDNSSTEGDDEVDEVEIVKSRDSEIDSSTSELRHRNNKSEIESSGTRADSDVETYTE